MTISPVAAQTQQQSNASSVSDKAASLISSDFETFLKMMTTQARYQDPLETDGQFGICSATGPVFDG